MCIQIGVGLMFLQQLSGSSGVTYYASSLFNKGGNLISYNTSSRQYEHFMCKTVQSKCFF